MSVSPQTLAVYMGRDSLTSLDTAQLQAWIDEAFYLIGRRIPDTSSVDSEALDYVVRQAVLTLAEQPAPGVLQESVQVDDGAVTTRYAKAPRRITILPEWWAMLGVADGKANGAFSIDMTGGASAIHVAWCSINLGATYCSCGADLAGYPLYEGGDL